MERNLTKKTKVLLSIMLVVVGLLLSLVLLEVFLRKYQGLKYGYNYYPWPPYLSRKINIEAGVFPGVSGVKNFYINSIGTRGDEPPGENVKKIITVGGSTTESGELDEQETWPKLLQEKLNQNSSEKTWVGNAARRGSTLRDNILQMKYFVSQIENVNTIILLSGINDFMLTISTDYKPLDMKNLQTPTVSQFDHAFSVHPYTQYNIRGTATWSLLKQGKIALFGRNVIHDNQGSAETFWREKRKNSKEILPNLPNIDAGLNEYRNNLNYFVSLAKENSDRVILLTQPSIYKLNMSDEERNLLWFGCIEKDGWRCYSPEALQEGLEAFNSETLRVCEEQHVECIDLAAQLKKDTSIFFDDVHFNENGAREVSQIIFEYL